MLEEMPDAHLVGRAREKHAAVVEAAVRRARRVESHSLASDLDKLVCWAQQAISVRIEDAVPVEMRVDLPPVEALESLAGRCRPFLLANDAIHYPNVFKALGYFLRENTELRGVLPSLRNAWARADRQNPDPLGAILKIQDDSGAFDTGHSIKELGYAWLYADLAHAHEHERLAVEGHSLTARYRAGAWLITYTATNVIALLNLTRRAHALHLLPIDGEIFAEATEPDVPWRAPVVGAAFGQAGTSSKDLEAALDRQHSDQA